MFPFVSLMFATLITESVLFHLEGLVAAGRDLFWHLLMISMVVCATIVRTGAKPRVNIIYARFSTDMQNPRSCEDQVRIVREALARKGIDSGSFLVLTDDAVSGTLAARDSFSRIQEMKTRSEIGILAVDDQARFTRATNASQFIQDLVFFGSRFISVVESVDTDEPGWQLRVKVVEVHNTLSGAELAHRVRRGLSSRVVRGLSAGDLCFGYESFYVDPIYAAAYRGMGPKPERGVRINEEMAGWVRQIYSWFVAGWTVSAIARELSRLKVSKGQRGRTTHWYASYVTQLPQNEKFIGVWRWGETTTIRHSAGDKKQIPVKDDSYATKVERPELQIIDLETWEKTRRRFQELTDLNAARPAHKRLGRKPGSSATTPAGLLNGLVFCGECGSRLWPTRCHDVLYLACRNRLRVEDRCPMCTHVHVARAEKALLDFVSELFTAWPDWIERTVMVMRKCIEQATSELPRSIAADQKRLAGLRRNIEALLDLFQDPYDPYFDSRSAKDRLKLLEAEVEAVEQRIGEAQRAAAVPGEMPDDAWIANQLKDLTGLVREGGEPAASLLCRLLGKVTAHQVVLPGKKRGYIQMHITLSGYRALAQVLEGKIPGIFLAPGDGKEDATVEVQLNVGRQSRLDELGRQIAQMREEDVPWKEIYRITGLESRPAYLAWRRYLYAQKKAQEQEQQAPPPASDDQEEAA